LVCTVLLGRAAIFGHKEDNGLQKSPRAGCLCGEGGDGCEEPTSQLHTCIEGKVIEEMRDFLEGEVGLGLGTTSLGVVGLAARFHTRDCCFLGLPSSRLRVCWGFGLRLLKPGRVPGGGHCRSLGCFRDRLGRVI
jgi:hypothetical protein